MEFSAPSGMKKARKINFKRLPYQLALEDTSIPFEIRYAVRPANVTDHVEDAPANASWHISAFEGGLFDVAGGYLPEYTVFDSLQVIQEFNADWGATSTFVSGAVFGRDYVDCLMLFLHKKNVANAYVFFLAQDRITLIREAPKYFYNLKFKEQ